MNGEIAVSQILRDDTSVAAIVGNRVWLDEAEQTEQLPFIILENRTFTPIDSKSGEAETDIDLIAVIGFSKSAKVRRDLILAIRAALDYKDGGVFNGQEVEQLVFIGGTNTKEQEENRKIFITEMEFELRVIL